MNDESVESLREEIRMLRESLAYSHGMLRQYENLNTKNLRYIANMLEELRGRITPLRGGK